MIHWRANSQLVDKYDLEGIITLSKEEPQGDADAWRAEVMQSGFMNLYSYLSYDQMCGKLGEGGLDFLDDVIAAAEVFHGKPLRELRAEVLNYRLDEVEDTSTEQAKEFALRAIDELSQQIPLSPSTLKFRGRLYDHLAKLDVGNTLNHWLKAIDDINASGGFDLWVFYHQWDQPIAGMPEAQQRVRDEFQQRIALELKSHPDLVWELLDSGIRIVDYTPLPELDRQIDNWLQVALAWQSDNAKSELLRHAGMLMHKQGKARQQPKYLIKAIACFEQFIEKTPAHAMEVNYLSNVWQDWAQLSEKQEVYEMQMMTAWEVYQKHEAIVRINFSPLLHYAEFLLQLYLDDKISKQPSREEVLKWAIESEEMGNGYYSGPDMIQVYVAINDNDAETAIYHLCRLLLRHELCIDDVIKRLRQSLTDKAHQHVKDFLDQALRFMDDVSEGYFYNPALTMEQLNKLSRIETVNAWQERMVEIRNRKAFNRYAPEQES